MARALRVIDLNERRGHCCVSFQCFKVPFHKRSIFQTTKAKRDAMEIQGRVALVTGGAIRVGKAITMMLARAGADVVVNYFSSSTAADETVAEAEALGVR